MSTAIDGTVGTAQTQPGLFALSDDAQDLLFRSARTANSFTDEPVDDDQLRAIYELVRWAPTSMNCQPLRILAVRGDTARCRVVRHMFGANQLKTERAPLTLLLAADLCFDMHLPRLFPYVADPKTMFADDDTRRATAEFNAILQAGYLILGVRAAGLAAGPMAGFDRAGLDAEFFPDGRQTAVLVLNVGKPAPDAWLERLPRLCFDEAVSTV
jgi:3-hydroxypropanoate dehydrogenase